MSWNEFIKMTAIVFGICIGVPLFLYLSIFPLFQVFFTVGLLGFIIIDHIRLKVNLKI